MRRHLLPITAAVVALALLALLAFGVAHQNGSSSLDAALARGQHPPAPASTLTLPALASSGRLSLAAFHGRVVVVNVFASWCDPCRAEAAVLEQAERRLAGERGTVLGVTYLDNSGDSERFVRQEHITYPVMRDVNGSFVHAYGTTGVPETFVIDRRGRVAAVRRFQVDSAWLERTLSRVLAGQA